MASLPDNTHNTTVDKALSDAPDKSAAEEVKENAQLEQNVAGEAASVAQSKGRRLTGEAPTTVEQVKEVPEMVKEAVTKAMPESMKEIPEKVKEVAERVLKEMPDSAREAPEKVKEVTEKVVNDILVEGKQGVGKVQAIGAEGVGQVKETASKVTAPVQERVMPQGGESQGKATQSTTTFGGGNILPKLQSAATVPVNVTKSTLTTARSATLGTAGAASGAVQNVRGISEKEGEKAKSFESTTSREKVDSTERIASPDPID